MQQPTVRVRANMRRYAEVRLVGLMHLWATGAAAALRGMRRFDDRGARATMKIRFSRAAGFMDEPVMECIGTLSMLDVPARKCLIRKALFKDANGAGA